MQNVLITGITGQDGFFLKNFLLQKKYKVFGLARKSNHDAHTNHQNIQMIWGDILNKTDIIKALQESQPHEIYHLASASQPGKSWDHAAQYLNINGFASVQLFDAIKSICPHSKIYHASSSEIFGKTKSTLQNESAPLNPINPYAASKAYAHHMAQIYRESHGLYISSGILFNHESERRPLHFLTQKVAYGAACASLSISNSLDKNESGKPLVSEGKLALGNLSAAKDWGYAGDFVQAMWLMLQQDNPDDYVIGTGMLHTVAELCEIAYNFVNKNWQEHIISDPALLRPLESVPIAADFTKAKKILNWKPSTSFKTMIEKMVALQIKRLKHLTK